MTQQSSTPVEPWQRSGDGEYRPTDSLLIALTLLLAAGAALQLIMMVLNLVALDHVTLDDPEAIEGSGLLAAMMCMTLPMIAVSLATIVLWCMWVIRASRNARALGPTHMRISPGWAAGWYFIPLFNLVMPYLAMKEICQASDPEAVTPHEMANTRVSGILPAWWAMWLANNFIAAYAVSAQHTETSAKALTIIVSTLVAVASAVLAIMALRHIHRLQEAKLQTIYG